MPYIGNIVQDFSVNTAMLNTDSVTSIKIDDGTIVNADISDSAAIAVSKLSGVMPSAGGTFSGDVSFGDNNITNVGTIALDTIKGDADDNTNINFAGSDIVNIKPAGTTRLSINTSGVVVTGSISATGSLACGDITSSDGNGNLTLKDNNHTGSNCEHLINFTASDDTSLMNIGTPFGSNNLFFKYGSTELVSIGTSGQVDFAGNVDCNAGLDVTGSVAVSGSTDGVLNLDTSDSRGSFVRFGQGGSFHNMVGCADGLITGLDKEDLGIRATDRIGFSTNGDNLKMTILSSGNVGIGLIDPSTIFHIKTFNPDVYLENTGTGTGQLRIGHFTNGAFIGTYSDDAGASDTLRLGTHSGDTRMQILTGGQINIGDDLTQTDRTVSIHGGSNTGQLQVKGTEADIWMSSTGANGIWRILGSTGNTTHRFRIYDSTNGKEPFFIDGSSGTNTSHVHINSGNLKFDQSGTGIDFHNFGTGTNVTSNLLDDYEEGTWTPSLNNAGGFGTNNTVGKYTKIGRVVHWVCQVSGIRDSSSSSGTFTIGGLPFAAGAATGGHGYAGCMGALYNWNIPDTAYQIGIRVPDGNSFIQFFANFDNSNDSQLTSPFDANKTIFGSLAGTYIT